MRVQNERHPLRPEERERGKISLDTTQHFKKDISSKKNKPTSSSVNTSMEEDSLLLLTLNVQ